jgi:alpha-glucuronidase
MRHSFASLVRRVLFLALLLAGAAAPVRADDGYDLWLRYAPIDDPQRLAQYRAAITQLVVEGDSPTLAVVREELARGLRGLLDRDLPLETRPTGAGAVIAGTRASSPIIAALPLSAQLRAVGREGYIVRRMTVKGRTAIVVAANSEIGVLYGTFALLRQLQIRRPLATLSIASAPRVQLRMLDHWDTLDRSVERGYAGASIFEWAQLPARISPRYRDYARANAAVGINAVVVTSPNVNARALTPEYLRKAAALAAAFRPYGIRIFLTARFGAPIEIGGLRTADPLDPVVRQWWRHKAEEMYAVIPDLGGVLVQGDAEGQPGPERYGRTHADGANLVADAVVARGGVVIWRAYMSVDRAPVDRARELYDEFVPLDGKFRRNVMVQVKNGPLDFQPREPFNPMLGAMPRTPLLLEFQLTKEYLGNDSHLVYLGALIEETLRADTERKGKGSIVARVVDGSLHGQARTGMAGVANVGADRNWTGSIFNQANWYAFGRLAWDPSLSARDVAEEWIRVSLSNDSMVVATVRDMMMSSREAVVSYMTPLGLSTMTGASSHYGPSPWIKDGRPDWTPLYYHRADASGLGFDRTAAGSNAVAQYAEPVRERYENRTSVPDSVLLWFHHVGWRERVTSGRTLWDELVHRYSAGVDSVRAMRRSWGRLEGRIDDERFRHVQGMLAVQEREARWWRDASLRYFQSLSRLPIPAQYEPPTQSLEFYMQLRCPLDPRRPRCESLP